MNNIDYEEIASIIEAKLENNNVEIKDWHINVLEEKKFYKIKKYLYGIPVIKK